MPAEDSSRGTASGSPGGDPLARVPVPTPPSRRSGGVTPPGLPAALALRAPLPMGRSGQTAWCLQVLAPHIAEWSPLPAVRRAIAAARRCAWHRADAWNPSGIRTPASPARTYLARGAARQDRNATCRTEACTPARAGTTSRRPSDLRGSRRGARCCSELRRDPVSERGHDESRPAHPRCCPASKARSRDCCVHPPSQVQLQSLDAAARQPARNLPNPGTRVLVRECLGTVWFQLQSTDIRFRGRRQLPCLMKHGAEADLRLQIGWPKFDDAPE